MESFSKKIVFGKNWFFHEQEENSILFGAVFILVGSRDERNFHLRALSAIAQAVQAADFDKDWLRAKSIDELRDIILLAERRREGT